ncbi:MAG: efflux RND transporter periplasmic adaptor subunit [Exilispira sp.]|jgi:HlyD family secretion protein|nr:efflux RND transporter periplasmic adaptor subunit [Exilispira sp.]
MKKKTRNLLFLLLIIIIIAAISFYFIYKNKLAKNENIVFTTTTIKSGNITSSVSASGNIEPIDSYPVMASISGKIDKVLVDFNSKVKKGQILAIIKQDDYIYALKQAELSYQEALINLSNKEMDYNNNLELYKKGFLTAQALKQSENSYKLAQIAVESAKVSLEKAKTNLENTYLKSPIDGFILERNVDEGDFISTNISQSELFIVCSDLSRLKITATVDESDISLIKEGQKVQFTVLAYDNINFSGTVKQIRLNSNESSNVVTYTVIIETVNIDNKLFPGMTASIEFINEPSEVAFLVPQTSISLKGVALLKNIGPYTVQLPNNQGSLSSGQQNEKDKIAKNPNQENNPNQSLFKNFSKNPGTNPNQKENLKLLWVIDETKKIIYPIPVKTGNTDGKMVEVFSPILKEGMKILSSLMTKNKSNTQNNIGMPPIRF